MQKSQEHHHPRRRDEHRRLGFLGLRLSYRRNHTRHGKEYRESGFLLLRESYEYKCCGRQFRIQLRKWNFAQQRQNDGHSISGRESRYIIRRSEWCNKYRRRGVCVVYRSYEHNYTRQCDEHRGLCFQLLQQIDKHSHSQRCRKYRARGV